MKNNQIRLKDIIGYGTGGVGENIAGNLFYTYFIFFLTSVAGINPAVAGTISLFAVAWDAISDPIIGYLNDRYKGHLLGRNFGKRSTFMVGGAIPLGISVFLLFCNVEMGETMKIIYFVVINIVFWLFYTVVDIPYVAVASEITDDYDVKAKMRTSVMVFSIFAQMLLSYGVMEFLDRMQEMGKSDTLTFRIVGAVFGVITAVSFIAAGCSLKGKEKDNSVSADSAERASVGVFRDIFDLFRLKQFVIVVLMAFAFNLWLGIFNSSLIYFLSFTFGFDNGEIALLNLWPTLISIIFIVPMGNFVVKFGRKAGLMTAFLYMVFFAIVMTLFRPPAVVVVLLIAGIDLATSVYWITIFTMNFDVSEIYLFKYEKNREGLMVSITSFSGKMGVAVGMWLCGVLMQLLHVDPSAAVVSDAMSDGMRMIFAVIPGIVALAAAVLCAFYKVSKKNIAAVEEAQRLKDEGKAYSTEGFKRIL